MRKLPILLLLFCFNFSAAQHIARKANLGISAAPAPSNEYGAVHAVAMVHPNTTAQNMDMKVQDILISLNGIPLKNNQDVQKAISTFVVGKNADAKVLRSGELVSLKGKVMAEAPFKKPEHEIALLEVPFREGYIRAYLTHPKGKGPFPTIYFIQGYACQSINVHPQSPTLQLTNSLVDMGYAVFRIEKPGVGEFVNLQPCDQYNFDDELESFKNGLSFINEIDQVDPNKIFLFGHSLGGNVAPLLAANTSIAGVMVYGTMIKTWQEYLLDMARYSQSYTEDPLKVYSKIPLLKSSSRKLYEEGKQIIDLTKEELELLKEWQGYTEDGLLFTRTFEFWQKFNQYDY
ncbi:MAG: alpha/beta hydrolase, partial [Bacteroidota bacterium]